MAKEDLNERFANAVNGSCKPEMIAAIHGNIPKEYSVVSLTAVSVFGSELVTINAAVEGPRGDHAGAKISARNDASKLEVAAELAIVISAAIRRGNRCGHVRIAVDDGALPPTRGSKGASGYDLYCPVDTIIRAGSVVVIHSGVHLELPDETWEAQIRPRSGMSKRGLWVAIGTVDSDYRGVVGATVANITTEDQTVKRGDRYAQIVFARVSHPKIGVVKFEEMSLTDRGIGGFGSTGV